MLIVYDSNVYKLYRFCPCCCSPRIVIYKKKGILKENTYIKCRKCKNEILVKEVNK